MGSEWQAPYELLKPETQDMTLALNSLEEELETMDWYNQRIDVSHDEELSGILAHNRDEEKEHANQQSKPAPPLSVGRPGPSIRPSLTVRSLRLQHD